MEKIAEKQRKQKKKTLKRNNLLLNVIGGISRHS